MPVKRWPWLLLLICLPVALLAGGVRVPWIGDADGRAEAQWVPSGDREIAWLHTTTSSATWERFVLGVVRTQGRVPGLNVDDSAAFQDSTTAVPEIVLSMDGWPGKLRIRWYKLRSDATTADWVATLASRSPAPLAVIGGGSTDRAVELAKALEARIQWHGDRPPLLITTATADRVAPDADPLGPRPPLVSLYAGRTFRFCFSNRQMADAVLDFVRKNPDLRPQLFADAALGAAASGLTAARTSDVWRPNVFSVQWNDDPYSTDLHEQFQDSLLQGAGDERDDDHPIQFSRWDLPYSVGGFNKANAYELRTAESIAKQVLELPPQRSLLVLPAVTQPARRLLHAILEAYPGARRRLVVVTGDGIPVNAMLRDGEFAWPMAALGIPVVFFTHANPVGWDRTPTSYPLLPPNSTEEVAHFGDMGRILAEACFPPGTSALAGRGDDVIARLRGLRPAFFDVNGERIGGRGEYVVVALPRYRETPDAIEVWRRGDTGAWALVDSVAPGGGAR